jgi:CHAT domain-containing protein
MKRAVALLLVCASCGHRLQTSPEEGYRTVVKNFRHGELATALAQARAGARQTRPASPLFYKFRLLEAEILIYQSNRPAAASILTSGVPEGPELAALEARRRMLQLSVLGKLSREEKVRVLDEVSGQASRLGDVDLLLDAGIRKGMQLYTADPEEARRLFLEARTRAAGIHDSYHEAVALNDLGILVSHLNRYDEAIFWLEQALVQARQAGARLSIEAALDNLAMCYTKLGSFDEAVKRREEAAKWRGPDEPKFMRCNRLGETGRTCAVQGDMRRAAEYYRQALALARELGEADKIRLWNDNLAFALAALGQWDEAEKANREELSLAATPAAVGFARLNAARIAAGRRRFDDAVRDYQAAIQAGASEPSVLWQSLAGLGNTYSQMGKEAEGRQAFEKAQAVIEQNRTGLSSDEYKITFLSRLMGFYQDYVESLMESGDSDKALEVADASRARILAETVALDRLPRRYTAADFQKYSQRTGRVLLSYWVAPRRSYAWVITPRRRECFRLPPADEIRGLVEQYKAFVEKSLRDPLETGNAAGRRLYDLLIAPAAQLMPAGARIVILPDGPLHTLNLETLPVSADRAHYWIEDATVSIAPSLGILMATPEARPNPAKSLLMLGDAIYSAPYPALRYSSAEVGKIGQHLPSASKTVLTGTGATPLAYLQADPERFSYIHFSAHAEANSQSPLDSAIILSPQASRFKLYARDIMARPLHANLVTISACRSAGARAYAGEGLVGLAWAFLRSGARYTVAGLWDVDDSSTPGMMDALYGGMESGRSPVEALRLAKLEMIHSRGSWRKPYYWGPFQIYGY